MPKSSLSRYLAPLLLAFLAGGAYAADLPETTHDGLQLVPGKVKVLYVKPGASLAPYQRVAITDCYVAFRKNWEREHKTGALRVSSRDMEKIKTGSVFEIAEVLRDLSLLKASKDLSFGERKMLETARQLLVKELAIAKGTKEAKIEAELDKIFGIPRAVA